jgi:hypothetical protein
VSNDVPWQPTQLEGAAVGASAETEKSNRVKTGTWRENSVASRPTNKFNTLAMV